MLDMLVKDGYVAMKWEVEDRWRCSHYCDTVMLLYFHCISGAPELCVWGAIASSCWLMPN